MAPGTAIPGAVVITNLCVIEHKRSGVNEQYYPALWLGAAAQHTIRAAPYMLHSGLAAAAIYNAS